MCWWRPGCWRKKRWGWDCERPAWVKTSLAPGSKVVTEYLQAAGLQTYLDQLGFNLVGYGCTTCIGNSGPLPQEVSDVVAAHDLVVASVLSGNRNFEGRINSEVRANYLMSPPLVVAFALAGEMIDMHLDPIGTGTNGPVYLKDIWPSAEGSGRGGGAGDHLGDVPRELCHGAGGRRALARAAGSGGRYLRVGREVHLHSEPSVL